MSALVIGCDPSLTNFGISDGTRHHIIQTKPADDESSERNLYRRATEIAGAVLQFVGEAVTQNMGPAPWPSDSKVLVVVEAPMATPGAGHLLEIGAVLYAVENLVRAGLEIIVPVEFVYVAPSKLRKALVGNGAMPKDQMKLEVFKRYGMEFENDKGSDRLFAWLCYKYGRGMSAGTIEHVPSARRGKGGKKPAKPKAA